MYNNAVCNLKHGLIQRKMRWVFLLQIAYTIENAVNEKYLINNVLAACIEKER